MGAVCAGGTSASVGVDSSVAVLPRAASETRGRASSNAGTGDASAAGGSRPTTSDGGKKGGANTAVPGSASSSTAASQLDAPPNASSASSSIHPNQYHYRSFDPSSPPLTDFHFKKRDHSSLPHGELDCDGLLTHTDFDIDLTRCDPDNDVHFEEYIERRAKFEEELKVFYEKTKKRVPPPLPANITYVRPFLSSTFKDFNEERNILFAGSFPRLEKLCNERNLFFAPLDLRWGVTSEQSGSGQVIKICLEEIDRSRPYFVCSLGFRNGWALMPQDNPEDQYVKLLSKTFELAESQFEWVKKCRDRSVTELEILHGALNQPELTPRCFFYFRDVAFLRALPKKDRRIFAEIGESEKRLQQLKTRIVQAGFEIRYFQTPQEMSDRLEEDLRKSIEKDFPIQKLTPLDREMKDHQAFSEMRTRVYVGGEKYLEQLDAFMQDSSPCAPQICVISGASGAGKSSLLSNWMKRIKTRAKQNGFSGRKYLAPNADGTTHEEQMNDVYLMHQPSITRERSSTPVPTTPGGGVRSSPEPGTPGGGVGPQHIWHWNTGLFQDRYIGSTSDSTQPGTLIRWILTELKQRFDSEIDAAVPQDPKKIIEDFPEFIEAASSNVPILLVLDGLDQLYEEDDAHHLLWLPKEWPKNVRVVLSTVHGSLTHKTMIERSHAQAGGGGNNTNAATAAATGIQVINSTMFLSVSDVSDAHCRSLIRTFLGSYGKNLDASQEERIMMCERTRNPLYLITFLQEVRVFGSFENLTKRIDHYMMANSVSEMFLKVIGRLEEDFNPSAPFLVRMTLSLMMLSRRGLNEVELKGALEIALGVSAQSGTFPNMEFSALMLRLDQQLVDQRGLRKFGHDYLRSAVTTKYFKNMNQGHHHMQQKQMNNPNHDDSTILTSMSNIRLILAQYFCSLPNTSERKVEEAPWHLWNILHESMDLSGGGGGANNDDSTIELDTSKPTSGLPSGVPLRIDVLSIQKQLQEQITDLESFEKLKGDYKYDLHKYWLLLEAIRSQTHGGGGGMNAATNTQQHAAAKLLSYTASCYSVALKKWSITLKDITDSTSKPTPLEFAEKAESIGSFLIATDRYNSSEIFLNQALEIRKQVQGNDHSEVELLLSKIANLYYLQGKYDEALPLYQQSLTIIEKIEAKDALAHGGNHLMANKHGGGSVRSSVLRTSIAGLLKEQGKFAESQPLYEKSLSDKIALLGHKHPLVAISMSNLAELYLRLHKPELALPLYRDALQIMESERGRSHPEVATIVSSLASCYMQLEKYDDAIRLYERARKIKEDLLGSNHVSVAVVLNNLAATYQKQGDSNKALKLLERSLKIRQAVHGKDSTLLVQTLSNMGDVYLDEQKYHQANDYFIQAYNILVKEKGKNSIDLIGILTSQAKMYSDQAKLYSNGGGDGGNAGGGEDEKTIQNDTLASSFYSKQLQIYLEQLSILEHNYGTEDERVLQSLTNLGSVHQVMGNSELALPYHLREYHLMIKKYGQKDKHVADVLCILGGCFVTDKPVVALAIFKRCFVIRRDLFGMSNDQTEEAKGWVEDLSGSGEGDDAGEEITEEELEKMKLEDLPLPDELAPPKVAQKPMISIVGGGGGGGHKPIVNNVVSLPPIGAKPGGGGGISITSSASSASLPPIIGIHPILQKSAGGASSSAFPSLPGQQSTNSPSLSKGPGPTIIPTMTLGVGIGQPKKKPSIVFT